MMKSTLRPALWPALATLVTFGCERTGESVVGGDAGRDGSVDARTDAGGDARTPGRVPLDPASPWPKFRANPQQDGRSSVVPRDDGRAPWVFQTGKGVFSTPVIDGEGNAYVGSADRVFYAIGADGQMRWSFRTGEIIDSSALLDDRGRVYFGSGDGTLYALDRRAGTVAWRFEADDPSVNGAFIRWFEGNVAMTTDGTLVAPNDNFCTYGVNRDDGSRRWCFRTSDQTWSLPALDARTGTLFLGNNFLLGPNVFAINAGDGRRQWGRAVPATMAASPMLVGEGESARLFIGGFDGFLRAMSAGGDEQWTFGARDHLYASPARLSDGTIIQPSADGTVYALDPSNGSVRWSFDALEPIRSSPAVDAQDHIYFGSGEGRMFVLNPDGALRWAIRLIDEDRNDLNASVALGPFGPVIAGENGGVFFVPYDYCLRPAAMSDARCRRGPGEDLPNQGALLYRTTRFGSPSPEHSLTVSANDPLAFSLFVRAAGDTRLALVDSQQVTVTVDPPAEVRTDVSGDRRFLVVTPRTLFTPDPTGHVRVRIQTRYLVNPTREGLRFSGGTPGGDIDERFDLTVRPALEGAFTAPIPTAPGEPTTTWELSRIAAPLPAILPSYNQIGFDSIHYLLGVVEGTADRAVVWGVGASPSGAAGATVVDASSSVRFPLTMRWRSGRMTLDNESPFQIDFNGFQLPFESFRISTRTDAAGAPAEGPTLVARAVCGQIAVYGEFLRRLGFCNPTTDVLLAFGAADMRLHQGGTLRAPAGVGAVTFTADATALHARFAGSTLRSADHNFGILVVDAATGAPRNFDYPAGTTRTAAADGTIDHVDLRIPMNSRGVLRVYAMVDAYPAARGEITLP